jgi:hypothetical protein
MGLYTPQELCFILDKVLQSQQKELNEPSPVELKLEWVKETISALFKTLETKTKEFNKTHNNNPITAADLISAVSGTLSVLIKDSQNSGV